MNDYEMNLYFEGLTEQNRPEEPVSPHKGWTITKDPESGLQIIRRPDGSKYGQTQTEAAARIMRRRAIERAEENR